MKVKLYSLKDIIKDVMLLLKQKEGFLDDPRMPRMGGDGTRLCATKTSLLKALHCTRSLLALMSGYCYGWQSLAPCFYPDGSL